MAIYNCAPTLPEAIDSLYAQTYKNFKLVLCDDGSTDDTYKVAEEYSERYSNIILLKNEKNIKLAASLNRCLEFADTEYIARMDGDDISLPTRFEKQIHFLDNNLEFALVSSPMIYFDKSGDWGVGKADPTPGLESFKTGSPHTHAPCMIRTEVMKKVDGYTVSALLERGQDYYLWYKIYKAGYRGYNLQEPLYKMRDDQDAMARRTIKNRYNAFLIRKRILQDLGIKNGFIYAVPSLIKAFIPSFIMKEIRQWRIGS